MNRPFEAVHPPALALREARGWTESPSDGTRGLRADIRGVAESEGWSLEALDRAAAEGTSAAGREVCPILGEGGEPVEWVTPEEKAIYDQVGVRSERVAGRDCLVRDDIDWDHVDKYGETNLDRARDGRAPLDPNGRSYEVHHVQQRDDGVLAELTHDEHQGEVNSRILHDKEGPSEIDRDRFDKVVRPEHWKARAAEIDAQREAAVYELVEREDTP